jgi:hypothetical protein
MTHAARAGGHLAQEPELRPGKVDFFPSTAHKAFIGEHLEVPGEPDDRRRRFHPAGPAIASSSSTKRILVFRPPSCRMPSSPGDGRAMPARHRPLDIVIIQPQGNGVLIAVPEAHPHRASVGEPVFDRATNRFRRTDPCRRCHERRTAVGKSEFRIQMEGPVSIVEVHGQLGEEAAAHLLEFAVAAPPHAGPSKSTSTKSSP